MSEASAPHAADRRELTAAQRNAVAELLRVSPVADELGRRFAAAGHELHLVGGSVRDALLGRLGDDLDFCTDAHPDADAARSSSGWAEAIWETGREFGTIGAPARRAAAGDHHLPGRGVRRGQPQPGRRVRHQPRRRPAAARLHGQRDGGQPARAPVHRPVRRPGRPGRQGDPHPGHARRSRSATTRCGCCGRPGSPRSCGSPSHPDVRRGDDRDGRRPGPDHRRADPRRVHQAALRRRPDHRAAAAGRHRAGRAVPARAARAQAGDRRARPAQGRLRAHPDRGAATRSRYETRRAATSCCGWPR